MDNIRNIYREAFKKHGDSSDSVLWPKGRQELRFKNLLSSCKYTQGMKILDYGCGLAHLKPFVDNIFPGNLYYGADCLSEFITYNRSNYPQNDFFLVESPEEIPESFDISIASGVFNISFSEDCSKNEDLVFKLIEQLYSKTEYQLVFDMMTDKVDFQQDGAYHQNISKLIEFISSNLSKRYTINHSYMPFEFSVSIWKKDDISPETNTFI